MALKAECDGSEEFKGYLTTLDACARSCRGETQMFIFGTDTYGDSRCNADGDCKCICEVATENSKCKKQVTNKGYDLYRFNCKMLPLRISYLSKTIYISAFHAPAYQRIKFPSVFGQCLTLLVI